MLPTGTDVTLGNSTGNTDGTLDLNSNSQTVAGLGTAGTGTTNTVTDSGTAATFTDKTSATSAYSGLLTGTNLTFAKDGTGVLTISGGSGDTYGGSTSVLNGTLKIGTASSVPSGTSVVLGNSTGNTSGTLDLNGTNLTVAGITTSGTGSSNTVTDSGAAAS